MSETNKSQQNVNYYAGAAKELAGKTVGSEKLTNEGETQKLQAQKEMETEKLQQRTEGKTEGVKDRVSGGIQETAGSMFGDENLKNKGETQHKKGQAESEMHK
ncbi:hypothetical protein Glove_14g40 [Diversispora epigaea]|uniref:CsbD-like domain-containing protein n=1 Tax=Diversispora epigaea TaxID=1348612 RepID=A0A397JPY8_9GLOM|nr:hypothetical protein Glove_14g40 [Diversispora epigaea]